MQNPKGGPNAALQLPLVRGSINSTIWSYTHTVVWSSYQILQFKDMPKLHAQPLGWPRAQESLGSVSDMLIVICEASRRSGLMVNLYRADRAVWGLKKLRSFNAIQRYLGYNWDFQDQTISMPQDKLDACKRLLASWVIWGASFAFRMRRPSMENWSICCPSSSSSVHSSHPSKSSLSPSGTFRCSLPVVKDLLSVS